MKLRHAAALALVILAPAGVANAQVDVVDKNGKFVGIYDNGTALREVKGFWLDIPVAKTGFFPETTGSCCAEFTTPDCSGTMYFPLVDDLTNPVLAVASNNVVFFVAGPPQQIEAQACGSVDLVGMPPAVIDCESSPSMITSGCALGVLSGYGPLDKYDLSQLKLKPPFRLKK